MNVAIKDLQTKGFVRVPYPQEVRWAVLNAMESWKKFCALDQAKKTRLPYSNNSAGVGYEFKDGSGNKGDRKENFDIALSGEEWLRQNIQSIGDPVSFRFLKEAVDLIQVLKPVIIDFAREVEQSFGIPGFLKEVSGGAEFFFVRFIHYSGDRGIGDETAVSHIDQGGFTPHLAESDSGFQMLTYDKKWVDVPFAEEDMFIIPSAQLQVRSEGKLRAVTHRVVANKKTAVDGRYSAVCFIKLKDTPGYDKERWGRLQEMEPGFNYPLSHMEFRKFFK